MNPPQKKPADANTAESTVLTPELRAEVDAYLAHLEAQRQPKPEPSEHPQPIQDWPKLGEHLDRVLDEATDKYENEYVETMRPDGSVFRTRSREIAVAHVFERARKDHKVSKDFDAWRVGKDGTPHHWAAHVSVVASLIGQLIENRHVIREAKRGRIVSNLPDAALDLIEATPPK